MEVVSEDAGVIQEQLANEGDTVEVGQAIAIVGEGSAEAKSAEASKSDAKAESKGESESETTTDTANKDTTRDHEQRQDEAEKADRSDEVKKHTQRVNATPSARRHALKQGVDLAEVVGKSNDVVRKEDIDQRQQQSSNKKAETAQRKASETSSSSTPNKPVIREKMSRRKKTAANKLLEVSNNTAMLTTFNEVDMTNVMELRKRKKEKFMQDHDGTKLGFMSFFTKAAVAALKKYPEVNAEIDGDDMIKKQYYDIGIAVSTDDGLLVPFVRDCDKKNFAEIEQEIANLAVKARDKKLGLDDMVNGSFTITNGGIFGSMMSTPIINGSQAAILGMHSIMTRPIAIDKDTIENRPMMYIALSYDHRIIDGKEAVGFLKTIKDLIENPEDLLLES